MRPRARTDEVISASSSEFEWEQAGDSEAHGYLLPPALKLLAADNARKVLDLGCGNGSITGLLASKGFVVSGCDASSSGLAIAQASFPDVRFFHHDLAQPLGAEHAAAYDAVVSFEVIEHLLLPRILLRSASEALRPGGLFILSTPYHGYLKNLALALTNGFDKHWHPLRDFGHIKFFSKQTLLALFDECGFEVTTFLRVGRIPPLACSMVVAARKR